MVSIDYRKSKAGYDNCFELNFNEREIIPYKYYKNGKYGASLRFFIDVLRKADMLIVKEEYEELIWCRMYPCHFNDISFTMTYDIDYDTISFSVEPDNCRYREKIAEKLRSLIDNFQQHKGPKAL